MDPTEALLLKTMKKLGKDDFDLFQWHLEKYEEIEESEVEGLNRPKTVNLLVRRFPQKALDVTRDILKQMQRNDLVELLSKDNSGAAGPSPGATAVNPTVDGPQLNHLNPTNVPAEKRLFSVRNDFKHRVSDPILNQLLDQLLQQSIINDLEMESAKAKAPRAEKAGDLIDMVRKKGPEASSALIAALCEVDPCLTSTLKLI